MANREYEHIIKHLENTVKIWNQTAYPASGGLRMDYIVLQKSCLATVICER